jgi:hypothetical protein
MKFSYGCRFWVIEFPVFDGTNDCTSVGFCSLVRQTAVKHNVDSIDASLSPLASHGQKL